MEKGTNLHHALLLANRHFRRHPHERPVLLVVTDGEPTSHLEPGGEVFFDYPPHPRTVALAVRELDAAARLGAQTTFFRLGDDPGLARFVDSMAKRAGGRVVAPQLGDLGAAVVGSYLGSRSPGGSVGPTATSSAAAASARRTDVALACAGLRDRGSLVRAPGGRGAAGGADHRGVPRAKIDVALADICSLETKEPSMALMSIFTLRRGACCRGGDEWATRKPSPGWGRVHVPGVTADADAGGEAGECGSHRAASRPLRRRPCCSACRRAQRPEWPDAEEDDRRGYCGEPGRQRVVAGDGAARRSPRGGRSGYVLMTSSPASLAAATVQRRAVGAADVVPFVPG